MSRRQWIGLAGVLFGALMIAGVLMSGTTPDTDQADAAAKYAEFWSDSDRQDKAALGSLLLTYACVLLVAFTAGLGWLQRRFDDGPLPGLVMVGGGAAAAMLGAGAALLNGAGFAAVDSTFKIDGDTAMLIEAVGYYTAGTGMMCAAAMALSFSLVNRRTRVLPQWTFILTGLITLGALGSIFSAWTLFMLFPAWSIIMGIVLLATKDGAEVVHAAA